MSNDARRRTPDGFFGDQEERITELERRLGALPERLSPLGQLVTDCDLALANGFYRVDSAGALHTPIATAQGSLRVQRAGTGSSIRQVFQRIAADAGVPDAREWARDSYDDGATWTAWALIS